MSKIGYLIELTGQGDLQMALVTQEVWDWINSPMPAGLREAGGMLDPATPECVRLSNDNYGAYITIGSWENDRALAAASSDAGAIMDFYDSPRAEGQFRKEIEEAGYEIADEYHGYIY